MSATDRHHEMLGDRRTSPLDDVHAAPYAAFAERILAGEIDESVTSANPLSRYIGKNQMISLEGFSEKEVQAQLDRFRAQFNHIDKETLYAACRQHIDQWEVVYDEERLSYVIYDEEGLPIKGFCIHFIRESLGNLYFPECLLDLEVVRIMGDIRGIMDLPPNVKILDCSNSTVRHIKSLPDGIEKLDVSYSHIEEFPDLPDSLESLQYQVVKYVKAHPKVLPPRLKEFDCASNKQLGNLPDLPDTLTYLNCGGCELEGLPELPPKLEKFKCAYNHLDQIPTLPPNVKLLHCEFNSLRLLPDLPDGIEEVACFTNYLVKVPDLPSSIRIFKCARNTFDIESKKKIEEKGFNWY